MYGLTSAEYKELQEHLSSHPYIERVILYGSRALGTQRDGSDIDITLIGKHINRQNTVHPLRETLEETTLPYRFDISLLKEIDHPNLKEHIAKYGKTLFERR
jgi:predicted nucleotidyltransferase